MTEPTEALLAPETPTDEPPCFEELDEDVPCPNPSYATCHRCEKPICWSHEVMLYQPFYGSSSVEEAPTCRACTKAIFEELGSEMEDVRFELRQAKAELEFLRVPPSSVTTPAAGPRGRIMPGQAHKLNKPKKRR